MKTKQKTALGVGLIGIGRKWGHRETPIPSEEQAIAYLSHVYQKGITFFDTAPAYGSSEERLGKFLQTLSPEQRNGITVATKFGEHWDEDRGEAYADHSFPKLRASIDQSIARLGRIDLLQVHKTTPEVLRRSELAEAILYARKQGIKNFGASVSDSESAQMVCESDVFSSMQFPFNESNQTFLETIASAHERGKLVVINRPFNMGGVLYEKAQSLSPEQQRVHAYKFILDRLPTNGIILTGTKSPEHLDENIEAFSK